MTFLSLFFSYQYTHEFLHIKDDLLITKTCRIPLVGTHILKSVNDYSLQKTSGIELLKKGGPKIL